MGRGGGERKRVNNAAESCISPAYDVFLERAVFAAGKSRKMSSRRAQVLSGEAGGQHEL